MKVSSIQPYCNQYKILKSPEKTKLSSEKSCHEKFLTPPSFYKQMFFAGYKAQFSYKPPSSKTPDFAPLKCNYFNLDKFSDSFSKKLDSQLMIVTKEDVEALFDRLKEKTGADDGLILEVLYQLTLYSNTKTFSRLDDLFLKHDLCGFGVFPDNSVAFSDCPQNYALSYLANIKKQVTPSASGSRECIILESELVDLIERYKNNKNNIYKSKEYDAFLEAINNNEIVFLNLPGWEIGCSDGKYRSANFLNGTGYLEDIAFDIIKRVQNGEKLDSIMYSNLDMKLRKILQDEAEVQNSLLIKVPVDVQEPSVDDVYNNLASKRISSCDIKTFSDRYFKLNNIKNYAALLKYLDESAVIYSFDSYADGFKKLYQEITAGAKRDGYSSDELLYVVPEVTSSHSVASRVYANVNDIDKSSVVTFATLKHWRASNFFDKPMVILDDTSLSGETRVEDSIIAEKYKTNAPLYFGYLVSNEDCFSDGILEKENYCYDDVFYLNRCKFFDKHEKGVPRRNFLHKGFQDMATSLCFPYMTPDNNNDFFSYLTSGLLKTNFGATNKGLRIALRESYPAQQFYSYYANLDE